MKKTIFLSIILVAMLVNLSAQSYSINKLKYDYHQYVPEYGDYYNPGISGVCSFIVPGLGQMLCGETGRGLAFFGGYTGCAILFGVGASQAVSNSWYYVYIGYNSNNTNAGVGISLLGLGGMAIVSIWSIIDAVHVAKVNNMYIRSLRRSSSIKVEMSPYVEQLSINNQVTTPVGMTMRVKF
jgi:TM2 domain-containing membrane protein YozV